MNVSFANFGLSRYVFIFFNMSKSEKICKSRGISKNEKNSDVCKKDLKRKKVWCMSKKIISED